MIGQVISHYRIIAKLGQGGMGEVWRAEDTRLGRGVALKLLSLPDRELPSATAGKTIQPSERFMQEARTVSNLNHPGIVTIYDVGEDDQGRLFIAMELVEGQNLRSYLNEHGSLYFKPLVRMAVILTEALARAHAAGVVHRDIKPENIMLLADGGAKLLDFGIAKLKKPVVASPVSDGATVDSVAGEAHTQTGTILGTVNYMSPEQVQAHEVDHRSDLFSVGAVLYECATGARPFTGSMVDAMYAIAHLPHPPVREVRPQIPEELERIIDKLLEKDPGDRYQNTMDLTVDLKRAERRVLAVEATSAGVRPLPAAAPAAPATAAKPRPWWLQLPALASAAALAGALLAGVAMLWLRPAAAPPSQVVPVTRLRKPIEHLTVSPDGKMLAFVSGDSQVYVALAATGDATQVTRTPGEKKFPRFSPDGGRIVFSSLASGPSEELWEVPAIGGEPRRFLPNARNAVWSPDGTRLAFQRVESAQGASSSSLYVGDPRGGNARRLATVVGTPPIFSAWTPDGQQIVFLEAYRFRRTPSLRVVNADGSGQPRELARSVMALPPAVSRDGRWVYYSAERDHIVNLWRAPVAGGEPQQVTFGAGEDHSPAPGPGRQLYFLTSRPRAQIQLQEAGGAKHVVDTTLVSAAQASPDGKLIAFIRPPRSGSGLGDLMVVGADGSNLMRLDTPGPAEILRWSPDSSKIAFTAQTAAGRRAYTVELESGKQWPAPEIAGFDTFITDISRGGDVLVYHQKADLSELRVMVVAGDGQPRDLDTQGLEPFGWSADGKWIGLMTGTVRRATQTAAAGVFLMPAAGGAPQRVYSEAHLTAFHGVRPEILIATRMSPPQFVVLPINDGRGGPAQPWASRALLEAITQFGPQALLHFDPTGERAVMAVDETDMDVFRITLPPR